MKIYTSVPRDFTRVKEKVIFNLTKRQIVCFGGAALVGVPSYFFIKNLAGATAASTVMVFIMIPIFLLAMYEKNGQTLEVIIKNYFKAMFMRKKIRPYRAELDWLKDVERKEEKKNFKEKLKRELQKDSPKTSQQSIPYQKMYKDGICKVTGTYYSKTILFYDRNYQLLDEKEKRLFLDDWGSFLKLFGDTVEFQLSFMSLPEDKKLAKQKWKYSLKFDGLDYLREEVSDVIRMHYEAGNKGLEEIKLLTFGIQASNLKEAKSE